MRVESLEGRTLLSFGTGGIVTTQPIADGGVGVSALGVEPADQKIVVAGDDFVDGSQASDLALVRYNTDGSLDTTFGSGGIVSTTFKGFDYAGISSIAFQPNGDIVAGGSNAFYSSKTGGYAEDFVVVRYTPGGGLDTTFGSGGEVTTAFPASAGEASIQTVLLRANGEILAVGGGSDGPVLLALYQSNGALDKTFGTKGTVVDTSMDTTTTTANPGGGATTVVSHFATAAAALEADGSVLVSGTEEVTTQVTSSSGSVLSSTTQSSLALVHYLASGARDLSFGDGGIAVMPITPTGVAASNPSAGGLAIQPDGAIVVVGTANGPSGYTDMVAARYNPNGTPDTTFGAGAGYTLIDLGAASNAGVVALQSNGQIVIGGTRGATFGLRGNPLSYEFATARLNADGSLDTTFGAGGTLTTRVGSSDTGVQIGLDTVGGQTMIVEAGTSGSMIAMVGYNPSGLVATTTAGLAPTGPVSYGQSATLSAAVTDQTPGGPAPTGGVDFFDATTGTDLGIGTLADGVASISFTPTLPIGTQTIIVSYGGDGNTLASSTTFPIAVAQIASRVVVSATPNPSTAGQSVTFTVHVTASPAPVSRTGTVDFYDTTTGTDLGTVALTGVGQATLTTSALPVGTQTITVTYSGDGNYLPSSASLSITVDAGSASALARKPPSPLAGPASAAIPTGPALILQALDDAEFLDTLGRPRRRR